MTVGGLPVPADGPGPTGDTPGPVPQSLIGDGSNRTYLPAEIESIEQVLTGDYNTRVWNLDWSPTGDLLAVCSGTGGGSGRFHLYSFNGTALTTLVTLSHRNDYKAVAWNPNGSLLALANSGYPGQNIKVYSFNGTALTEVASGLFQGANCLAWSPNGRYLAAIGWYPPNHFGLFSFNGTALTLVDTYTVNNWGTGVVWNPDGTHLALTWRQPDPLDPYMGDIGKAAILSFDGSSLSEQWLSDLGEYANSVDWNPDGDHIAFSYQGEYPDRGKVDVYHFSLDRNGKVVMDLKDGYQVSYSAASVCWNSNGHYLLHGGSGTNDDCGIATFDGSNITLDHYWGFGGGAAMTASWSWNGKHIALGGVDRSRDLKVYRVNYGPLGYNDTVETDEDVTEVLDVLANDRSTTGDITVTNVTSAVHGAVQIAPDGRAVIYTPPANWSGSDNLTYRHSEMEDTEPWPVVNITVAPVNDVPAISTTDVELATEDQEYIVQYEATDADPNDVLTWSFLSDADWLTFDTMTQVLSGTPTNDEVSTYQVSVKVTDSNITTDEHTFRLTVENVNDAPEITISGSTTAKEDALYSVYYVATDIDPTDDELTWSMETDATWLGMFGSHLTGTPTNDDVGDHLVNITVSDGNGGIDWTEFTITVANTNDAPIILTSPSMTATEDEGYDQNFEAEDVDVGDVLSWSMTGPAWLTMEGATLSGTPSNDDVGTHGVTVAVSDGAVEDTLTFTITVANTNDAPTWLSTPEDQELMEGDLMFLDLLAEDEDGDRLTYGLTSTPSSGMRISPATGAIRWLGAVPGTYEVRLTATDGTETITHALTVAVEEEPEPPIPPPNKVPVIEEVVVSNATAGEAFTLSLTGSDGDPWDAGNLTFTLVSGPAGMVVSAEGTILWLPTEDQVGTYPVVVELSDTKDATTYEFDVEVVEADKGSVEETSDDYMWLVIAMAIVVVILIVLMVVMHTKQR
jgi:hypothetical protein